nr:MAG TPA: helix-turn-helix domain protein [Caudoviricetes sp.]
MKERIKQARLSVGLSQKALADKIGISDAALSKIESGANNPAKQTVIAIANALGVSLYWLETGEGEMYAKSASQTLDAIAARYNGSPTFRAMLDVYSRLSRAEQDAVEHYIFQLAEAVSAGQRPEQIVPGNTSSADIGNVIMHDISDTETHHQDAEAAR